MNPEISELALSIMRVRTEALDPLSLELRQNFIGSIAAGELVSRQQELAHNQANELLLHDLVELLPAAHYQFYRWSNALSKVEVRDEEFRLDNVTDAKLVQASVYEIPGLRNGGFYYVFGRKPTEDKEVTELLLFPDKSNDSKPKIVPVLTDDLARREREAYRALSKDGYGYTKPELDSIYDDSTGKLILHTFSSFEVPFICQVVSYKRFSDSIRVRQPKRGKVTALVTGISDAQLATFDVINKVSDIASLFGLSDKAAKLLERYLVKNGNKVSSSE